MVSRNTQTDRTKKIGTDLHSEERLIFPPNGEFIYIFDSLRLLAAKETLREVRTIDFMKKIPYYLL